MHHREAHPTDGELLQALDTELSGRHQATVNAHLLACDECRRRQAGMAQATSEVHAIRRSDSASSPSLEAASRARLRSRLETMTAERWQPRAAWSRGPSRPVVAAAAAVAAVALVAWLPLITGNVTPFLSGSRVGPLPASSVTPGATANVSAEELCAGARHTREISAEMRRQVLVAYGMERVPADEYELDYLITPELGGATDPRNLWPQPYGSRVWNARVKDELEDLLPALVCSRQLDLQTAQRDMAVDWIAAYKKYFKTDRPRSTGQGLVEDEAPVRVYAGL